MRNKANKRFCFQIDDVRNAMLNAPAVGNAAQRTVTMASDDTTAATVTVSDVATGATSANFTVTSQTVSATTTPNISATHHGGTQSTVLTVTP